MFCGNCGEQGHLAGKCRKIRIPNKPPGVPNKVKVLAKELDAALVPEGACPTCHRPFAVDRKTYMRDYMREWRKRHRK